MCVFKLPPPLRLKRVGGAPPALPELKGGVAAGVVEGGDAPVGGGGVGAAVGVGGGGGPVLLLLLRLV